MHEQSFVDIFIYIYVQMFWIVCICLCLYVSYLYVSYVCTKHSRKTPTDPGVHHDLSQRRQAPPVMTWGLGGFNWAAVWDLGWGWTRYFMGQIMVIHFGAPGAVGHLRISAGHPSCFRVVITFHTHMGYEMPWGAWAAPFFPMLVEPWLTHTVAGGRAKIFVFGRISLQFFWATAGWPSDTLPFWLPKIANQRPLCHHAATICSYEALSEDLVYNASFDFLNRYGLPDMCLNQLFGIVW